MAARKKTAGTEGPEVSVIIAAWQAEGFLVRSIENALAQEGVTVEVIVVDDASEDDTYGVARAMADRDGRVTALRLAENSGPSGARNAALAVARGDWVAALAAAARMAPRRLPRMMTLAEPRGADLVLDTSGSPAETRRAVVDALAEVMTAHR